MRGFASLYNAMYIHELRVVIRSFRIRSETMLDCTVRNPVSATVAASS